MNQQVQPQKEEFPPEFDRRGANRAASQWIRNALHEQGEKIDGIKSEVHEIKGILEKTIPESDWDGHRKSHLIFLQREEELRKHEAEHKKLQEEQRLFWSGIKQDIIKYSLRAAGIFLIGIFILGGQAKFKEWIRLAMAEQPAIEVKK